MKTREMDDKIHIIPKWNPNNPMVLKKFDNKIVRWLFDKIHCEFGTPKQGRKYVLTIVGRDIFTWKTCYGNLLTPDDCIEELLCALSQITFLKNRIRFDLEDQPRSDRATPVLCCGYADMCCVA